MKSLLAVLQYMLVCSMGDEAIRIATGIVKGLKQPIHSLCLVARLGEKQRLVSESLQMISLALKTRTRTSWEHSVFGLQSGSAKTTRRKPCGAPWQINRHYPHHLEQNDQDTL